MGFKKKYKIGDRIGPYNILIIDDRNIMKRNIEERIKNLLAK